MLCVKAALTKAARTTVNETVEKSIFEGCANPASTPEVLDLIAHPFSKLPGTSHHIPQSRTRATTSPQAGASRTAGGLIRGFRRDVGEA